MTPAFPGNAEVVSMDGSLGAADGTGPWISVGVSAQLFIHFGLHPQRDHMFGKTFPWLPESHMNHNRNGKKNLFLRACLALGLGASPLCCGGLGSQEFTPKKAGFWIWLCTQNRNPESTIERAQNHLDILKGSNRNKCIFSLHELKYECLLQFLLGNNLNLLSLLLWPCTKAAEFFRSCCLAPRNMPFS